jgi:hypothetical protein
VYSEYISCESPGHLHPSIQPIINKRATNVLQVRSALVHLQQGKPIVPSCTVIPTNRTCTNTLNVGV